MLSTHPSAFERSFVNGVILLNVQSILTLCTDGGVKFALILDSSLIYICFLDGVILEVTLSDGSSALMFTPLLKENHALHEFVVEVHFE